MLVYLKEAWRIAKRRWFFKGIKQYDGNAKEICEQIIKDCWNGRYFQTSAGHFNQFWTRDFGWCCESLLKLGYKKEVKKTLEYALDIFSKKRRITTSISPNGGAFDMPCISPDSLAYFIRCLKLAKFDIKKYKNFLNKEINAYFRICIDTKTGLVKKNRFFSSMKDQAKRKSSCYDNCMMGMLGKDLDELGLDNPFKKFDYKKLIKKYFWNGKYFYDDLTRKKIITGDSNIFPFYCSIFKDKKMMESCFQAIQEEGLDKPLPLKYSNKRLKMNLLHYFFTKDYETNSIWMHMGPLYVKLVKKVDKKKYNEYVKTYTKVIEDNRNFLEVFDSKGGVYKTPFYYSDESMLWAANFLKI